MKKDQTVLVDIKEGTAEELSAAFENISLDGIRLDAITKKRIIIPKNCFGNDTSTTSLLAR